MQMVMMIFFFTKLYVPVVTLSARDNKKLSKVLSRGFERSVYWNEYKAKSDKKNAKEEFKLFLRKLATEQDEGCTTGCLLDYDYIKNLL